MHGLGHEASSKVWRRKSGRPPKRNACELQLLGPWPVHCKRTLGMPAGSAVGKVADRPKDICGARSRN